MVARVAVVAAVVAVAAPLGASVAFLSCSLIPISPAPRPGLCTSPERAGSLAVELEVEKAVGAVVLGELARTH
jgi:hypothetical protein